MSRAFPKKIYVTIEDEGTDDQYLSAKEAWEDHAEANVKKRLAVYRLEEVLDLTAAPTLRRKEARRP